MVSSKKVKKIYEILKTNQESGRWEEENYVSNIYRQLNFSRKTVHQGIKVLEDLNVVDRKRKGRKNIIKLKDFSVGDVTINSQSEGARIMREEYRDTVRRITQSQVIQSGQNRNSVEGALRGL